MQRVRDNGDRRRRDDHEDDGETDDRADLATKVTQREGRRSPVQQRRNEDEEENVWWQRDPRQPGDERDQETADDEDRRVGNRQALGDEAQSGGDS